MTLASYPLSECVPEAVEQGVGRGGGCGLIPRGAAPGMAEVITPKKQVVVDRLRRRIEGYRRHQSDCIPRYNQAFTGLVEQNIQDTLVLKQRYLESKSKRAAKKTEKKIPDNPLQSLHAVAGTEENGFNELRKVKTYEEGIKGLWTYTQIKSRCLNGKNRSINLFLE
ncbi:hypothetical protein J6590_031000 [Homalodisca vitripennis]|nr:hypothetical protein J6590_031000 [Homalodisca vitripennis]